jgi:hypothetical protein
LLGLGLLLLFYMQKEALTCFGHGTPQRLIPINLQI